jgi:hypothetical protein
MLSFDLIECVSCFCSALRGTRPLFPLCSNLNSPLAQEITNIKTHPIIIHAHAHMEQSFCKSKNLYIFGNSVSASQVSMQKH